MAITITGGFSTANKEQMQKLFDEHHPLGKVAREKFQIEKAKAQEAAIEKIKSQPIKEAEKMVIEEEKTAKKKKK